MTLIQRIKNIRLNGKIALYRLLPLRQNKIIFWANSFKQYGCSPKYITEYLLREYPDRFDIVWVFEDGVQIPDELDKKIRAVRYFSYAYLRELHTAKFVVCNMRTGPAYLWKKRKGQIYIQTWHSSLRLKKIEGDAAEHLPDVYIQHAKEDSKRIDFLLSGCRFSTEIFKRAFWYNGIILETGTPRCDILVKNNSETRKKVFQHFRIPESSRLVLYAPTFRSSKTSDYLGMDFARLKKSLEGDQAQWTIGARLHPNILHTVDADGAVAMSKYSDMQELLVAADLLITDYSSCMFDMAIARKPCVLYAPDFDEYVAKERGLYFDLRELPFPIAETMDELREAIRNFDLEEYLLQVEAFLDRIGSFEDGNAAKRVCEFICQQTAKKEAVDAGFVS